MERTVEERLAEAEERIAALEGRTGRIMGWFTTIFPVAPAPMVDNNLIRVPMLRKAWDVLFGEGRDEQTGR